DGLRRRTKAEAELLEREARHREELALEATRDQEGRLTKQLAARLQKVRKGLGPAKEAVQSLVSCMQRGGGVVASTQEMDAELRRFEQ
ncbi:unnamed protein product, partial [Polarella glacialis]